MQVRDLKLLKTKKGRDETGLFIIEGEKFVREIPPQWRVVKYIAAQRYAKAHDIAEYESRAECTVVRDSIFDSLADTVNPQGLLAVCEKQVFGMSDLAGDFFLLGENFNDPGNIGALVRTAAAAGVTGIILTAGSGDIYNAKVLRAAAGAVLRVPFVVDITLQEAVASLRSLNIPIYAAHPRGQDTPYSLDLRGGTCILIGNESHGISREAENLADGLVTLPMANSTESLNASVAGSILMYEAVRQRMIS